MSLHEKADINRLNYLVLEKEQEWRGLVQQHAESLVKELAEKNELIALEKLRFKKLKEDFEYNLKLLEERDKALCKYEKVFEQFKANDNLNRQQASEMNIKIDDFKTKLNILQMEKEEVQHHYQIRLKKYEEEMKKFYSKKEEEHEKEKNEYEDLKRKLQMQIRDAEEEIGFEKQKLMNQLEQTLKEKERNYQIKLDQNQTEIHQYQLKVRLLSRELQLVQVSNSQVSENLESNNERTLQLGKLLKEKEWELEDLTNMKEIRIKELEAELKEGKKNWKQNKEESERKYCEQEKLLNERERIITNLKVTADVNDRKFCEELKMLQQRNEEMELNFKRLQWQMADYKTEKENEIRNYADKTKKMEMKLNTEIDTMNKITVAKDLEIENLRSSEDLLKQETDKLKNNIEKLKKDLSLSLDRERILENAKTQLELDWRRRYENKSAEVYEHRDHVIENMTKEKDEALTAVKQMETKVCQCENLIKLLQDDKEVAIRCLHKLGIDTNSMFADAVPERDGEILGTEGINLHQQNIQLKEVVREMRAEMEMLNQQITTQTSTPIRKVQEASNYVKDLEDEVQELKSSNRQLLHKIEDLSKGEKPPIQGKMNLDVNDPVIKSYVKQLNETIGTLKTEKVQIKASLNSKEAAIDHFNKLISKLTNEKQQLLVLIDNLKYDMSSKNKVFEANICSLKERISELELQLKQSRGEAEIYYKTVMERSLDAAQVNNKLSDLKLQQSACNYVPQINYPVDDSKTVSLYKEKLKLAVERIKELTKERLQLINVGNKLRSDLLKSKGDMTIKDQSDESSSVINLQHYGNKVQSQLEKLELLQYQATTDELKEGAGGREIDVEVRPLSTDTSELTDDLNSKDHFEDKNSAEKEFLPSPITMSSEHSSIKEIWKLLENAQDSLQDTAGESKQLQEEFALVGRQIETNKKNIPSKLLVSKAKKVGPGKNKPKIRNYNVKKDN